MHKLSAPTPNGFAPADISTALFPTPPPPLFQQRDTTSLCPRHPPPPSVLQAGQV